MFFAIAYLFRSLIKFIIVLLNVRTLHEFSPMLGPVTLVLFLYFSSMAVFYLLYGVLSKKWDNHSRLIYLFHLLAFVIGILIAATKNLYLYLTVNVLLLFFVFYVVFVSYKESRKNRKKKHNMYLIYLLLSIFWIFNIIDILVPDIIQSYQLLVYIISISIFMTILYKVIRKTG